MDLPFERNFHDAIESDRPTLVMFYKDNSGRSENELPKMIETARKLSGEGHFYEIDCSVFPDLRDKYHIDTYPTFILFMDGEEAWRACGSLPVSELEDMVHRFE